MNKEDKKLQKHLVDEMMKVSETNPDVIFYMESLMKSYEEKDKEIERLNKQIEYADKINNEAIKRKEKYKIVLNQLEQELEQNIAVNKTNNIEQPDNPEWYIKWNCYLNILDKLKELKEGKNEKF